MARILSVLGSKDAVFWHSLSSGSLGEDCVVIDVFLFFLSQKYTNWTELLSLLFFFLSLFDNIFISLFDNIFLSLPLTLFSSWYLSFSCPFLVVFQLQTLSQSYTINIYTLYHTGSLMYFRMYSIQKLLIFQLIQWQTNKIKVNLKRHPIRMYWFFLRQWEGKTVFCT